MKNNIIKDDREISIKAAEIQAHSYDDTEAVGSSHNLATEPPEIQMKTETPPAISDGTEAIGSTHNLATEPPQMPMKTETPPAISDDTEAIGSSHNLLTEPPQMSTETLADMSTPTEPMMMANDPIVEPAEAGQSIQTELTTFVENATATITELFNNNRQIFITLGWIVLAIFSAKIVFATLGIIDDIPLITPLIKLVGLVSVVRFSWRYLIREQNRKELIEILDRTKVEVLGDRG
jgi:CAAD domains of cyanobacterial aminoacyl-tRNA synthetase